MTGHIIELVISTVLSEGRLHTYNVLCLFALPILYRRSSDWMCV